MAVPVPPGTLGWNRAWNIPRSHRATARPGDRGRGGRGGGAGGTALALTTSAPSHAVAMSRGDLTRAALKVTAGTPFLDVSMGRLGGTLLRVSTPDDAPVRPVLSGSGLIVLSLAGASAPHGVRAGLRVRGEGGAQLGRHVEPGPGGRHPAHQGRPARRQGGRGRRDGGLGRARREPAPAVGDAALPAGRRGEPVPAQPARRRAGPGDGGRRRVLRVGRRPEPDRDRGRDGADAARLGHRHVPLRHRRDLRVLAADGQPLVRRPAPSPVGAQRAWIGRKPDESIRR